MNSMASMASILLIDDGELDDVRALLEELETEFVHMRGDDLPDELQDPRFLLVSTARRAVSLRFVREPKRPRPPVRIAVCTGSSKTQRNILKRAGFDYLVSRPVHPAALRLLLLRAIYRGQEKREATRFAFGYEVTFRTGFRRRKALLAEVSAVGCRILSGHNISPGSGVTIQLPRELVGGKSLDLRARVVRVDPGGREGATPGELSIGFRFEELDEETKNRLRGILVERYWGPAMLPDDAAVPGRTPAQRDPAPPLEVTPQPDSQTDPQAQPELAPESEAGEPETGPTVVSGPEELKRATRRHPRAAYDREVIAICPEATRVLVGLDLSPGGMRVEPHPRLTVGGRVRLAIYATGEEDPFVVEAHVMRDDGELGLALRFDWMDHDAEERLTHLLGTLPSIESLGPSEAKPLVLTELVPDDEEPDTP
jgi:hypothetical protein